MQEIYDLWYPLDMRELNGKVLHVVAFASAVSFKKWLQSVENLYEYSNGHF